MLDKDFFKRDVHMVAKELLGKTLHVNGKEGIIVETESYLEGDPASHCYTGPTPRSKVMYERGGTVYVYISYGIHHLMNIVTGEKGQGQAILIRALQPVNGLKNPSGPARLTKELNITKQEHNGFHVFDKNFHIKNKGLKNPEIKSSGRIGISKGKDLQYRYFIKNNSWVSK